MVNEYILGYSTKEYLVIRKKGRKNKRMANYICPHCGHTHLIDINNFIKRIEKYRERRGRR